MAVYILVRLLQGALLVFLMSIVAFCAIYAVGNPISVLVSPTTPQSVIDRVVTELGLDRPLHEQYFIFLRNLLEGDFGYSYVTGQPALGMVLERFPATLELAVSAMVIAMLVGVPLGVWAGYRPNGVAGKTASGFSMLLISLPPFWTALLLIIIFSIEARMLPTGGRGAVGTVLGVSSSLFTQDGLRRILLPAVNLSLFPMAMFIRLTSAGVRETVSASFIRFARAKGLSTSRILSVYILKNIVPPVVTVSAIIFGMLLAFSVITESIFSWPGTGHLIIKSIQSSDRPVVIAYLMFSVSIFIVINIAADVVCAVVDPRISLSGSR